ncbi:hypothetical protein [Streptomyces sp. L2]|uniref:hypothetical protein n=1 Tax=Streptomyces sp. L2 TaxID=2162665 RepID=UPI00101126A3|nr:hypothetical protein [Streptomyces sp. L2]
MGDTVQASDVMARRYTFVRIFGTGCSSPTMSGCTEAAGALLLFAVKLPGLGLGLVCATVVEDVQNQTVAVPDNGAGN